MSSRRPVRQLLVAVLLGVLVGGGLMAVTPAGAEVSQAAATSWKKIWKKELKPLAAKAFYTKKQSDSTFATKAESAAGDAAAQAGANAATDSKLGSYYKKSESDAKYAGAGSSYTKAESDGRFARAPQVIRGVYATRFTATAAGQGGGSSISFGINLAAAPTTHFIPIGTAAPAGCSGTPAAPSASAGHLCVFQGYADLANGQFIADPEAFTGAGTMGAYLATSSTAAGPVRDIGSWALGVGPLSAGSPAVSGGAGKPSPDRTR